MPDFDAAWYLATYPDVAQTGANPLVHYVRHGWLEGRNPSPRFNTRAYLGRYPDDSRSGVNPLAHYLDSGIVEGRTAAPDEADDTLRSTAEPERIRLRASSLDGMAPTDRVIVCLTHVMPVAPRAGNEYRIHRMLTWLRQWLHRIPIVACGRNAARQRPDPIHRGAVWQRDSCQRRAGVLYDVPDAVIPPCDRDAAFGSSSRERAPDGR